MTLKPRPGFTVKQQDKSQVCRTALVTDLLSCCPPPPPHIVRLTVRLSSSTYRRTTLIAISLNLFERR